MPDQLDILFVREGEDLDPEEAAVWRVIREREGRESAIKVDMVGAATGLSGVKVRETVSHLVNEHGKLIGSRTANPPGFYVITDGEELREHIRSLRHRGIMCLVRAAALSKSSVEEIFKQGHLEYDNTNSPQ